MDTEFLKQMTGAPMTPEAWKEQLDRHARFVKEARPSAGSSWQVLDVSGMPLAMWQGYSTDDQLNLKFGNLTGLSLDDACLIAAAMPAVLAENVTFRRAKLRLALLTDARLDGANFEEAELDLADFSRASLRNANFRGVTGTETDFENCDLSGADFTGSDLLRPRLGGAKLDGVKGLKTG